MTLSYGPVTFASPMVTIPLVTIGAGTASGLPHHLGDEHVRRASDSPPPSASSIAFADLSVIAPPPDGGIEPLDYADASLLASADIRTIAIIFIAHLLAAP